MITGASGGIGSAVALRFAEVGCNIGIHCHSNREAAGLIARDVANAGASSAIFTGDLRHPKTATETFEAAVAHFGGIDILVNNAGGMIERRDLTKIDDDFYTALMDLNVRSLVTMSVAAMTHFRQRGSGVIINVSSIAARGAGGAGQALYSGAKGFVSSFTRKMAIEAAPFGVRVNAIAPGAVMTEALQRSLTSTQLDSLAAMTPLGRVAQPMDCTGAFLFLASDSLSGFITGHVIEVTGGL